ncbi:helix-turn-helix domain-containing protein [Roseobacter sp. S98]|uniref:helix-turn-helix domain-containing protein n=1 Tax=Roseobacter algicola (ex Choi et al. 2025) (nom. illeg.) TaxID=3092138 RepID=UPI003F50F129
MPKRPNPMAINKALTYAIEEAANALGVTTATIRNYVRRGLPIMTSQRPYLISGEVLRVFLSRERERRRKPLQADQLFCPSCKDGRRPFGMMVDLFMMSGKSGRLAGLCEICDGPSQRMISTRQIKDFAAIFDIKEQANSAA